MNTKTLALCLGVVSAALFAAEKETAEIPTIIVEASRIDSSAAEIPAAVQVITREQLEASGADNLVDVLHREAPTLNIHHLGGRNPAMAQIAPAGYGENGYGRLLVMVDGERLNNPDMNAQNLAQIPFGAIRKIEILQGSQCVLHGNGAAGGVINIITMPDDYELHGRVEAHGGSFGTFGGNGSISGGDEATDTLYWGNGGFEHSDGYRHRTGYDIYNIGGGIKQFFDNGSYLKLSTFFNDSDYELPGELTREEWHTHPTLSKPLSTNGYGKYERKTYGLSSTAYGKLNEENALKLDVSLSNRRMDSSVHMGGISWGYPWSDDETWKYNTYLFELTPQWINTTELFAHDNEFILGALYRYERLHANTSSDYGYGAPTYAKYALNRETAGAFAQDTFYLSETFAFEIGARYERIFGENTSAVKKNRVDDVYALSAAILYTPIENFKSYLRVSRFFNSPHLDETVGGYDANYNWSNLRTLRPEYGSRVDLGFDYEFLKNYSAGLNLFASTTKHEVLYCPLAPYSNNINAPWDILRHGINGHIGWEEDKLAGWTLAYSGVRAEFADGEFDGNKVPLTSEHTLSLNGKLWIWDDCYLFGGYRYQSEQFTYSDYQNSSHKIPAYGLAHIGLHYAPSYAMLKGWKATLTVDNLTNKNYCDYAGYGQYYWPGEGRSVMLSLAYEF